MLTQAQMDVAKAVGTPGTTGFRNTVVVANGQRIFTRVSTLPVSEEAPPVVLVHGLALSGTYMMPLGEALAPHYRVYAPDLPGHGESHKPARTLDVAGLADALAAWMHAANIPYATLFGNSFGCQIIGEFAARHPQRVSAAVLQGPTAPPEDRSWLQQYLRWRMNWPHNPPEMDDVADADYAKCGVVRALITFQFSLNHHLEDVLPQIAAPILVVRGELDPICRQPWAELVTKLLPDGRLKIMPGVAHTLVFTAPIELAEASRPFLDEFVAQAPTAKAHAANLTE
jgi:2-hydroxy-6-oxonona-2,4-dienedioate hydrolase